MSANQDQTPTTKKIIIIVFFKTKDMLFQHAPLFFGLKKGNDQEVEFHEIKIHFYRISNYFLTLSLNYFASFHEVEISNNDLIS